MYIAIAVVAWLACGVLAYGITLADFQRRFPLLADLPGHRAMDMGMALIYGAMGPPGLVFMFCLSGFARHGLMFRLKKRDE